MKVTWLRLVKVASEVVKLVKWLVGWSSELHVVVVSQCFISSMGEGNYTFGYTVIAHAKSEFCKRGCFGKASVSPWKSALAISMLPSV